MRRVLVRGSSGSGKTTFAARLAARLGVPHVELDALHHLPDWRPRPTEDFRRLVAAATSGDGWVVDGNYEEVREVVRGRIDTVVWLDLSRGVVMWRIVTRTLARVATRRELWHGNRESLRSLLSNDPERNIVLWAWRRWPARHREALAATADPGWAHARIVRLTSPRAVATFLHELQPPGR